MGLECAFGRASAQTRIRDDSSMMGDDYTPDPWYVRATSSSCEKPAVFGKATKLIEMPISWSLDDYPHFKVPRGTRN